MSFNVETMSKIANKAAAELKSKALGGVSKESAVDAIQHGVAEALKKGEEAVAEAVKAGQEAVGRVQKELAEVRGKTAQEIADLTSQKDEVVLKAKEELKKAKAVKTFEKVLPNGNKEIRKVNRNGAVMVREVTPEGKNVRTSVTTLEGDYRKTTYNAATGKPMTTFTNVNGDKLIKYNAEGRAVSEKNVNVIKTKPQKPQLQKTEILKEDSQIAEIRKTFTDGSYTNISYSKFRKNPVFEKTYDKNGKLIVETQYSFGRYEGEVYKETKKFNPETGKISERINVSDKFERKVKYNEKQQAVEVTIDYRNGFKQNLKVVPDEYGMIDQDKARSIITYPKESKIKTSKITKYDKYNVPEEEVLSMKDGSKVVLKNFDNDYNPHKVEIYKKGEKTPQKEINDYLEVKEYLRDIGKMKKLSSQESYGEKYFSHSISSY